MAEYIEREALVLAIEDSWRNNPHIDPMVRKTHNHEHQHFLVLASKQPTADVVPVVRCKDCKHFITDVFKRTMCNRTFTMLEMKPDDYCSYGERRCEE